MDPRWSSIDPLLSIEIGCLFGKAKNQKLEMKPKNIALTQRKNSFVIIVSSKTNERAKTEINLSDITNYRLFSGEGLATPLLRMNAWNGEYTIKFDVDRDRANWMAHLKVAIGMVQKNFEWLSYFLFVIYPSSSGHKDPALLRLLPEDEPVEIVIENPITHDDIQRFYMRQLLEFDYSNGNIVVLTFTNNTAVTSHECVKSKFDFRCFWARSLVAVLTKRLTALGLPFKSAKVGGEFRRSFSKDEAPLSPQRKTVDFQSNRFPSPRDDATSPRDSSAESERYRRRSDGQWPANTANSSAVPEATGAVLANSGAADYPDSKLQQVPEHFPPAPPPPTNVPEEAIDGGEEYLTDASALPPPPAFLSEPPPLSSPSPSPSAPVTEIYPDATRVTEIYPDATRVTEIYPDATRITEVYPKATHRTRTQSISPSPLDASAKGDGAKAKCLTLPNRKIRRISRDVPTDKPSDDEYAPLSPAKNTRPVDLEAFRRSFRIVPQYSTDSDVGVAPALPVSPMTPTHVPRNTPTSTALGAMSRQDSGLYVNMEAFSQFHLHEDIEPMYPPTRSPPKPSKPPRRQTSLTENTETDALDQAACGTVNARQDQQAYSTSEEHRKAFRAGSARPKPAPRPHSLRGLDWTKASHPSE
ncbi:uncharacterized protein LOC135808979 [Sycon ciliatum]|uniref:uncharacterized protein LOC135808979 n=1 Tax=Sycon ciliatum TaxID=27933 RepID=UPI0031F67954